MLEVAALSPWMWLHALVPRLLPMGKRCHRCNASLRGSPAPTIPWCAGFAWVLHQDGRHLCYDCADKVHSEEEAARRAQHGNGCRTLAAIPRLVWRAREWGYY